MKPFGIFGLLLATLLLFTNAFAQTAPVKISGLESKVTVNRDSRSIPYISAANESDLYFIQGYVTASDRLWQMDLMRRVARGETAEIFGKSTLEEDKRWRDFGFAAIATQSLDHLSTDLNLALKRYSDGVNAYIGTLDETSMPVEFRILQYKPRPWTPADSVIIGKILADALSSTWRHDLLKASLASLPVEKFNDLANVRTDYDVVLFGKDDKKSVAAAPTGEFVPESVLAAADRLVAVRETSLERIGFHAEDLAASNNWVISGSRTAHGKPILANDPHLRPSAPGIWYLTHLDAPGIRVAGVTFPGVPGVVLGHNDRIAWGATNVGPDAQDLFIETIDEKGNAKVPGGIESVKARTEIIQVRDSVLKPATSPVEYAVRETRNGPVILEEGGLVYSLKWTARDPKNNDFAAFFLLNRARDWKEFRTALATYAGATQNFVYADTTGNIGWQVAGAVPIRKKGDGSLPYDGTSSDGDWIGTIPLDELPHLYNPASGFIITANQRIAGTSYKYPQLTRDFASPWRARRIFDLLSANKTSTPETVGAVQFDAYNIPLHMLAKEIVKTAAASAETKKILESWDGVMSPHSTAAIVVNQIRECVAGKIADDNKPVPTNVIRERILFWALESKTPRWLPKGYADYAALIETCDSESTASLTKRFGSDKGSWQWGSNTKARFPHPLAAAPLIGGQFATPTAPLFGSGQTPNVASAVSMRFIATPGNWDNTQLIIPLGQSGDPKSPHFKDQFDKYAAGQNYPFPFSKAEIGKAAVSQAEFIP